MSLGQKWVSGFSGPHAQCRFSFSCPGKSDLGRGLVFQKGLRGERGKAKQHQCLMPAE